jgi:hypothetical protein
MSFIRAARRAIELNDALRVRWPLSVLARVALIGLVAVLGACSANTMVLSGTVVGLGGTGLVLTNYGVDDLSVGANGKFEFKRKYPFAYPYLVQVKAQPRSPNQSCVVSNGTGRLTRNVSNIIVTCTNTYVVGGTITGLSGAGLKLQNNSIDDTPISANGTFRFKTEIVDGQTFNVSISTQPAGQLCHVANNSGTGTIHGADFLDVQIECGTRKIGGTATGLVGTLVLQNNGGDDLNVVGSPDGSPVQFSFSTKLYDGANYSVSVATQPQGQNCTISSTSGTVSGADVTNVSVSCGFTVSGTVTGLVGTLVLQNNGDFDSITISVDRSFTFFKTLTTGQSYNVTVKTAPGRQGCAVANGTGIVNQAAISNVTVTCQTGPRLSATLDIKRVVLSWTPISAAVKYRVFKGSTGQNFTQIGSDILPPSSTYADPIAVHLTAWANTSYKVQSCYDTACTDKDDSNIISALSSVGAIGYLKASNTDPTDPSNFGDAVAISGDGNTLAIGAPGDNSAATGIDGNQAADCSSSAPANCAQNSGAVYVIVRDSAGNWSQQAYIKASNAEAGDKFGTALALSGDGNKLVIGAPGEASSTAADPGDNGMPGAGAAYVFDRSAGVWIQSAYLKASNPAAGYAFGASIALSRDGNTIAVGSAGESSAATGIDGNQAADCSSPTPTNCAIRSGATYVFTLAGATWTQQAYVKASNTDPGDLFGSAVALSGDGATLLVGAPGESSNAIFGGGTQTDNSAPNSGAAYVFSRDQTGNWSQQAYLKASNTGIGYKFGSAVALSGTGDVAAIGAPGETYATTDSPPILVQSAGAAYVFARTTTIWNAPDHLAMPQPLQDDKFGASISLSDDSAVLAVGIEGESSGGAGVGLSTGLSATGSGAAGLYGLVDNGGVITGTLVNFIKASNTGAGDGFGHAVSLSSDGQTLIVGAPFEDGSATGVGGNQTSNGATDAGAAYLY